MVPSYVIRLRDTYLSKVSDRRSVRDLLFADLLELQVPELFGYPDWRNDWLVEKKLPRRPVSNDEGEIEKWEPIVPPETDLDAIWNVVEEAMRVG
jgi:hypothetical protein